MEAPIYLGMSWEEVLKHIHQKEKKRYARYSWGVLWVWLTLWALAIGQFWVGRLNGLPEMTEEETWVALASFFPINL